MKIIAKTNSQFVITASHDEVANLIGYYSAYQGVLPKEGDDIKVNDMYKQLYKLRRLRGTISAISTEAKNLLEVIEEHNPLLMQVSDEIADAEPKKD